MRCDIVAVAEGANAWMVFDEDEECYWLRIDIDDEPWSIRLSPKDAQKMWNGMVNA